MAITRKEKRQLKDRIIAWQQNAERNDRLASQYRNAAAILQSQGRDLDAIFFEELAGECAQHASKAREITGDLQSVLSMT